MVDDYGFSTLTLFTVLALYKEEESPEEKQKEEKLNKEIVAEDKELLKEAKEDRKFHEQLGGGKVS